MQTENHESGEANYPAHKVEDVAKPNRFPLANYYNAVIESAEKACDASSTASPQAIIGCLGTKLALILRASRECQSHGELIAAIQTTCGARVKP